ncbi:MAG: alkyl sulfatase dimerization domain-containing protein [Actinomycetota bacterium]|nr:alkyl sulfatase dimerization domain-containing protein [Actinomycetota bacterium]MDD5667834.1 alkyl sulfatase dimerization domain-containing protein [Actinomycetota bacterium]
MSEDTSLGSQALFSDAGGMKDFGSGVYMLQLFANVCMVDCGEGVVIFDAGLPTDGWRIVKELRAVSDLPVRYIIYGHGHADHAFGTKAVLEDAAERGHPRPVIVAHENLPKRFDRYQRMLPYHERINRIQFAIPEGIPAFPWDYIYPDETFSGEMTLRLGDITIELRHARGETDDHVWMWVPERGVACVSDFWVWSCPNVGNPFKVQRYALEWAQALEEVAALKPGLMLPGHGAAIAGTAEVEEACLTVARALRYLDEQVVEMLNQGRWQEDILHSFEWPDEFAASPYLAPIYGHPYFVVQALLRQYHGWYGGNPSRLFPASGGEVAEQVLELAGGAEKVMERARKLAGDGRTQLALHLVDFVLETGTGPRREALELKSSLLEGLAAREKSLIARNIFLGGVRQIAKEMEQVGGEEET